MRYIGLQVIVSTFREELDKNRRVAAEESRWMEGDCKESGCRAMGDCEDGWRVAGGPWRLRAFFLLSFLEFTVHCLVHAYIRKKTQ